MTEQELLDMEVSEVRQEEPDFSVLRVPGGWIYTMIFETDDKPVPGYGEITQHFGSVYVPEPRF